AHPALHSFPTRRSSDLNTLNPNQTAQFNTNDILPFLAQTDRPIQLEIEWSAPRRALGLDVITIRVARQRDPATGAILAERGRHRSEEHTSELQSLAYLV